MRGRWQVLATRIGHLSLQFLLTVVVCGDIGVTFLVCLELEWIKNFWQLHQLDGPIVSGDCQELEVTRELCLGWELPIAVVVDLFELIDIFDSFTLLKID